MNAGAGLGAARPSGIGEILVSSRSFAEYRSMFRLTDSDLRQRILDCPGGASGFTAGAVAAGAAARACDPLYGIPAEELSGVIAANRRRAQAYIRAHPDEYEWKFFADPDDYEREREESAQAFVTDYRARSQRYVAAALPRLPFPDDSFDLVLCSHLLFAYADRFELGFHLDAIRELMRVCSGEVRIFPLFSMGARPQLDLEPLVTALAAEGFRTDRVEVDYRFQRGEPFILVCKH
ncbi:MAG TPA: methyltransferase domain-containing protein [Mycobacteriales bacterium]|nr:methyltransferase domain-containing protein [Mycobacteriales bacterium]